MSVWKTVAALVGVAVLAFAIAQNRGSAGESGSAASACGACHQGERSFAGRDSKQLASSIRAIADGKVKHPPLGLKDTTDEAIAKLAAELAAAK